MKHVIIIISDWQDDAWHILGAHSFDTMGEACVEIVDDIESFIRDLCEDKNVSISNHVDRFDHLGFKLEGADYKWLITIVNDVKGGAK